ERAAADLLGDMVHRIEKIVDCTGGIADVGGHAPRRQARQPLLPRDFPRRLQNQASELLAAVILAPGHPGTSYPYNTLFLNDVQYYIVHCSKLCHNEN